MKLSELAQPQKQSVKLSQIQADTAQYGGITKTPTMLERTVGNLKSPRTRPMGLTGGLGVLLGASGIPEENILPVIGQGVGGLASGFTGVGTLGAVAGSTLGEAGKEAFKSVRGENPDYSNLPKNALITGALEAATRGAGNFVFRRQIANEALNTLGKQLGEMKDALSKNPELKAPVYDVYASMREAYDNLPEPMQTGSVASKLKHWIKYMSNKPELSAKDLIMMEGDLGKAATYGEFKKGAFIPATEIPNPAANKIAQSGRKQVSDIVDNLAENNGQKGFAGISKRIAKLLENPEKTDITKATGGFGQRLVVGGAVGTATQNPLIGAGTYLGMQALQSPELRNLAFKAVRSAPGKAIGSATKLTASEMARGLSKKK